MRIKAINQQKIKRINLKQLLKYLEKALRILNISSQRLSIVFCDNNFIKKLNKRYFKKLYITDVISFPLKDNFDPDYLGEIIVSVEEAVNVAKRLGCRWQDELKLYLIHGILHLLGYDDRTSGKRILMEKKQDKLLKKLSRG